MQTPVQKSAYEKTLAYLKTFFEKTHQDLRLSFTIVKGISYDDQAKFVDDYDPSLDFQLVTTKSLAELLR